VQAFPITRLTCQPGYAQALPACFPELGIYQRSL
jgi:hypothetical protein